MKKGEKNGIFTQKIKSRKIVKRIEKFLQKGNENGFLSETNVVFY